MTGPPSELMHKEPPPMRGLFSLHAAPRPPSRATTKQPQASPTDQTDDRTHTDSANTPTHTEQLTDATPTTTPQPQLPTPRKQRLPSTTFNA